MLTILKNLYRLLNQTLGHYKWYQRQRMRIWYFRWQQSRTGRQVRGKGYANVVFFATSIAMWRYQQLYEILAKDPRFHLFVVITSMDTYSKEIASKHKEELVRFFRNKGITPILHEELNPTEGVKSLRPDLLFYVQPYDHLFGPNACFDDFKKRLIGYYPYGLQNSLSEWGYNNKFHNVAWRLYYPTPLHLENARKLAAVKGENVVVVGEPHADEFNAPIQKNPWKNAGNRKKIIWAPHFQIIPNEMYYRPSFTWTYDLMLEIARIYQDQICIAFKPHPRLFSTLCEHPNWGKEKAQVYYQSWKEMPNTQFEDGEFIDLFKTSDALIHDCGSFTAEYQYTKKPCMFLTRDEQSVRDELCPFGEKCLDNHYIGRNKEDIIQFINEIVINGNDPKAEQRQRFYTDYLLPPNGKTTAENTYIDLISSLFNQ